MEIRRATERDVSRIGEILVFNNRLNFLPIFQDEHFSFGEVQVLPVARSYAENPEALNNTYIADGDGIVQGLIHLRGKEVYKLYVDPYYQGRGIGGRLLDYAVERFDVSFLWALEKNARAIAFYARHGFFPQGERMLEEGTTEYLIKLTNGGYAK